MPRVDVNKEDWKAVNDWIAAVLSGLPLLGLKTIEQLGGGRFRVTLIMSALHPDASHPPPDPLSPVSPPSIPPYPPRVSSGDCEVDDPTASSAPKRWGKSRPFPAVVRTIHGLCKVIRKNAGVRVGAYAW